MQAVGQRTIFSPVQRRSYRQYICRTCLRLSALPYGSSSSISSDFAGAQQQQQAVVDTLQQQLQQLQQVQVPDSQQSLQAVQQYSSQAAAAAASALSSIISPFAVFGDSWGLNILFIGSIGLLVYSLLVLAPRQ